MAMGSRLPDGVIALFFFQVQLRFYFSQHFFVEIRILPQAG